jgi:hypothetical protein
VLNQLFVGGGGRSIVYGIDCLVSIAALLDRIVVATIAMTMAGGREDEVAEDENAGWRRIDGAIFAACHIAI